MQRLLTTIQLAFIIAIAPAVQAVDFRVEGKAFMLDGKKFQIRSGEIHYSRVPRAEWGNRIALAKAMRLNTICTYVFWDYYETARGEFDFTGEKDFIAFVRECDRQGMKAMVRPGPYVCAEWDLGGLPAWLLAEPGIKMRTVDPRFMEPACAWMERMGRMLQPLSVANGGPLLMVQVENEYGHFAKDTNYMIALTKALRSGGYDGMVFTGDGPGPGMQKNGAIPGELKSVNFGGNAARAFDTLAQLFPDQPEFTSEFWVGWFDEWGSARQRINTNMKLDNFQEILRRGASFNLYMFHGGTTRGYWTAGNWKGGFSSATCCHDWSALLDESARSWCADVDGSFGSQKMAGRGPAILVEVMKRRERQECRGSLGGWGSGFRFLLGDGGLEAFTGSVSRLTGSTTDLTRSANHLTRSANRLTRSANRLTCSATELTRSANHLTRSAGGQTFAARGMVEGLRARRPRHA